MAVPYRLAVATAMAVSSWARSGKPTLNVVIGRSLDRACAATTSDESIPPLSSAATGTSATACRFTGVQQELRGPLGTLGPGARGSGRAETSQGGGVRDPSHPA